MRIILSVDIIWFNNHKQQNHKPEATMSCDAIPTQHAVLLDQQPLCIETFPAVPWIHHAELYTLLRAYKYAQDLFNHYKLNILSDNMLCVHLATNGHAKWKSLPQHLLSTTIAYIQLVNITMHIHTSYVHTTQNPADHYSRITTNN